MFNGFSCIIERTMWTSSNGFVFSLPKKNVIRTLSICCRWRQFSSLFSKIYCYWNCHFNWRVLHKVSFMITLCNKIAIANSTSKNIVCHQYSIMRLQLNKMTIEHLQSNCVTYYECVRFETEHLRTHNEKKFQKYAGIFKIEL